MRVGNAAMLRTPLDDEDNHVLRGMFVTFLSDTARFAIPVAPVVEILEMSEIAPLPRAPKYLLGLIDRRGTSVPVVDLRRLLGQQDTVDTTETRLIVLQLPPSEAPRTVGLRVDRVTEVAELDAAGAEPLKEAGLVRWNERMVAGIGKRNSKFVTVIDVVGLFDPQVSASIKPRTVA